MSVDSGSFVSNFTEDKDNIFLEEDNKSESSNSSSDSESNSDEQNSRRIYDSPSNNPTPKNNAKDKRVRSSKKIYIYSPPPGQKDQRISPKRITDYEYCRLIGMRADQISKGAPVHPRYVSPELHDLIKVAQLELDDRSIEFPLNVYRPIGNPMEPSVIEVFNPHEPDVFLPKELLVNHIDKYIPKNTWRLF